MSRKALLPLSILMALALVWLTAPYASGCIPDDSNPTRCLKLPKPVVSTTDVPIANLVAPAGHVALPSVPAVPALPATGKDPNNAIEPDGTWQYVQGNSMLWYKMTDSRLTLEAWVDANGQGGLDLAIFAPEQTDLWGGKPVGRGAYNKFRPEHDLFWTGYTRAYGTWYATLTNRNSFPVNFSINYQRVAKYTKDFCAVCHGYEIQFDDCEDRGGNFCGGLEDSYK